MGRSSIGVPHAVYKPLAVRLLLALGLDVQALRTIARSSIDWERALVTSDSVRMSSTLEDRTGEIEALELKEGQMLILPWCLCSWSTGWYLCWLGTGMVRFSAQSLAESQVPDRGIAVVILQCSRKTSIA
jgi:hypothetical protein